MNTTVTINRLQRNLFVQNLQTFFLNRQALIVGLVFASDSLLFGSWVAHIPHVKERLHLSDAELGLTLFAMPIGLIIMNPLTGLIISRLGEAKACFWSAIGLTLAVCIPINAPNMGIMALGLFFLGLTSALLNVAMNTSATNVERSQGISIMSSCHGMWSLGGLLGSGIAGTVIALHVSPSMHMAIMAGIILVATFLFQPILHTIPSSSRNESGEKTGASFVMPNLDLLLMIFIGLAVAMGEGVALDWSAVYLHETLGASSQIAALGFGAFSLTMTSFRFLGDGIIPRIGAKRWLQVGGFLGALGLVIAIAFPYPATALVGFALLGVGCSLGAPILYSASMRVPGIPPAAGLATFATFSFIGFLAGPPVIGFVAESFGLYYGLGLVAFILLISAGLSRIVKLF
ncbi:MULTISPECIES: MFS transporter [unclassified Spirosoma]|uniref:MFS transporter n=1 Tax=unclassified Spirosoma TaxID=2621999 RepID=UPI00095BA02E|nr:MULTISPECIES: MFS transporter [unclassified Spirosoma]MBN8821846.1 MFS transporter [Spirosoma sp.]OJW80667.1 MAG: MFS transporter [Spirosoma sp. 48-14]